MIARLLTCVGSPAAGPDAATKNPAPGLRPQAVAEPQPVTPSAAEPQAPRVKPRVPQQASSAPARGAMGDSRRLSRALPLHKWESTPSEENLLAALHARSATAKAANKVGSHARKAYDEGRHVIQTRHFIWRNP